MTIRVFTFFLLVWLLTTAASSKAQTQKAARIGYLANTEATSAVDMKPLRERLKELGYVEGQNLTIEFRYFGGDVKRLPELAAELVRLKPDVIAVVGNEATAAAKNATKEIPIVMIVTNDAVRRGFVASLARPGGNVTGRTSVGADIYGKRLELLNEIIPKFTRAGFFWSPSSPVALDNLNEAKEVARSLKIDLMSLEAKEPVDVETVIQSAVAQRVQGLILDGSAFVTAHQNELIGLEQKHKLPTMYPNTRFVAAGGLMTYEGDRIETYRRSAEIIDKILKGTKPTDIPVERHRKFEFVVNLKTAKQIGLTIPPNVLARATRVLK